MPSTNGKPLLWEVWNVDQLQARVAYPPKQSIDPTKDARRYLIIADPLSRNIATCCPIQGQPHGYSPTLTEVFLPNNYGGFITKDCLIHCHEIFTMEVKYFNKYFGTLGQTEQVQVADALYEFLRI